MKNKKLLAKIFLIFFFLFSASQVFAICEGPIVPCGRAGTPPCQFCHIFVLLINIINLILKCFVPIVAGLMLIISGLLFMISHFGEGEILPGGGKGGPKLFSQAKKAMTAVVIGLVIIFLAWVFLNTLFDFMGVVEWTGLTTWWDFTEKCPIR